MLAEVLEFLQFSNRFRTTYRSMLAVGEERKENDVEHSFQLAMFSWFLIETFKLALDINLVIKYALIHDLDETFDGDKHIFDVAGRVGKEEVAQMARERIMAMFPKWDGYKKIAEDYKNLVDEESRFVNGLDKVLPVLNIVIDKGRTWHGEDTTLKMLLENKRPKVAIHPVSKSLWEEVEKILIEREVELFGKKS